MNFWKCLLFTILTLFVSFNVLAVIDTAIEKKSTPKQIKHYVDSINRALNDVTTPQEKRFQMAMHTYLVSEENQYDQGFSVACMHLASIFNLMGMIELSEMFFKNGIHAAEDAHNHTVATSGYRLLGGLSQFKNGPEELNYLQKALHEAGQIENRKIREALLIEAYGGIAKYYMTSSDNLPKAKIYLDSASILLPDKPNYIIRGFTNIHARYELKSGNIETADSTFNFIIGLEDIDLLNYFTAFSGKTDCMLIQGDTTGALNLLLSVVDSTEALNFHGTSIEVLKEMEQLIPAKNIIRLAKIRSRIIDILDQISVTQSKFQTLVHTSLFDHYKSIQKQKTLQNELLVKENEKLRLIQKNTLIIIIGIFIVFLLGYMITRQVKKVAIAKKINTDLKNQINTVLNDLSNKKQNLSAYSLDFQHTISFIDKISRKIEILSRIPNPYVSDETGKMVSEIETFLKSNEIEVVKSDASTSDHKFEMILLDQFPSLTKKDISFLKAVKTGKSNRELAQFHNIEESSIKVKKYRLKDKMGLDKGTNLKDELDKLA